MDCDQVREKLEIFVLDGLSPDERQAVLLHLGFCHECRREEKALLDAVRSFQQAAENICGKPADLEAIRERTSAEIQKIRAGRRIAVTPVWLARVAAVALVFLGVFLVVHFARTGRQNTERCSCAPWQYEEISPSQSIGAPYPLIRKRKAFVFKGRENDTRLIAIDKRKGKCLWESELPVFGCSLSANEVVVFVWGRGADGSPTLIAVDQETGKIFWQCQHKPHFGRSNPSQLVVLGGRVCWTKGTRVFSVDTQTGRIMWSQQLGDKGLLSAPSGKDDRMYIASGEALYCLDTSDGGILWRHAYGTRPASFGRPLLCHDSGKVFVAKQEPAGKGTLRCHDAASGELQWEVQTHTPGQLQAANGKIYLRAQKLDVLDGNTGNLLWTAPLDGCAPVAWTEGRVLVVGGRDRSGILALDSNTGTKIWRRSAGASCAGLVVVGHMGYLITHDGVLHAIEIEKQG